MLRVDANQAEPGMTIALPVLHPTKPGHVLLKPGARLDAPAIGKLREMRVPELWIEYPPLAFLAASVNPRVSAQRARITATLARDFDAVSASASADLDFVGYAEAVSTLLDRIGEDPGSAVLVQDVLAEDHRMLAHASNVCFLSVLLGLRLTSYVVRARERVPPERARQLDALGVGALLHDVGMLRIDREARARWDASADETDTEWRRHVIEGFRMVREHVAPTAAAVVLHHHQRYDGGGFPLKTNSYGTPTPQAGDDIHVFARIVSVADQFDRLRRPPSAPAGSRPVPNVRALSAMLDLARARAIDPVIFAALLSVAPAYPPGSIVRLASGRRAVVTGWDPAEPCRPSVAPIVGPENGSLSQVVLDDPIDLRAEAGELIAEIDGRNVFKDNFFASTPGEFDVQGAEYLVRSMPGVVTGLPPASINAT